MDNPMICPQCGHLGEAEEFVEHNADLAPDLFGTYVCPMCEHFFEE